MCHYPGVTAGLPIFSIGHSTHELPSFAALLRGHGIEAVADVRTVPRSRRVPHFNAEVLAHWLDEAGLTYAHLKELGGWRRPRADSPNRGWRTPGFQGYADHMQTPEFEAGIEQLVRLAKQRRTAYMCAESMWWRCHRRLLSDALVVRGWHVSHIRPDGELDDHELTPFALVEGLRILYPSPQVFFDV